MGVGAVNGEELEGRDRCMLRRRSSVLHRSESSCESTWDVICALVAMR